MARREFCMPIPVPIPERIWKPMMLASEVVVLRE
jgi:hypothetical protein